MNKLTDFDIREPLCRDGKPTVPEFLCKDGHPNDGRAAHWTTVKVKVTIKQERLSLSLC
jgi:hypothetical protein